MPSKEIKKSSKFKLGDIVISKSLGCHGLVIEDPKYKDKLVIQIHPYIFGNIDEDDWELLED